MDRGQEWAWSPARCDARAGVPTVETIHLDGPGGHGLRAAFAPGANMVLHSLTLGGRELLAIEIGVALEPTEDIPVPVSFGFHPYLRIPGGERATAQMSLPVRRALVLDASMIPTGETEQCEPGLRQLGDTDWDDGFSDLTNPPRFLLGNHGSEISLTFLHGYRFAQVFAPRGSDFVCFEPMTAPTNALAAGGVDLPVVAPGDRYGAAFEIAFG